MAIHNDTDVEDYLDESIPAMKYLPPNIRKNSFGPAFKDEINEDINVSMSERKTLQADRLGTDQNARVAQTVTKDKKANDRLT